MFEYQDHAQAREIAEQRLITASSGKPPTDEQRVIADLVRERAVQLAATIIANVPPGRDASIALTSLEDVLMRTNRGIFSA